MQRDTSDEAVEVLLRHLVATLRAIVERLERLGVRYMIVGSVAALAHGHARSTQDFDIVADLDTARLRALLDRHLARPCCDPATSAVQSDQGGGMVRFLSFLTGGAIAAVAGGCGSDDGGTTGAAGGGGSGGSGGSGAAGAGGGGGGAVETYEITATGMVNGGQLAFSETCQTTLGNDGDQAEMEALDARADLGFRIVWSRDNVMAAASYDNGGAEAGVSVTRSNAQMTGTVSHATMGGTVQFDVAGTLYGETASGSFDDVALDVADDGELPAITLAASGTFHCKL